MNINRHNYEAFFLDHVEGRLSPEQEIELMEFLSLNPDLAVELTDYESIHLDKEEIIFERKSGIKKNERELTPAEQLIALIEGDLTPLQATELKKKIQTDRNLQAQSELLLKTKLVPDTSIQFPNKNKLRHRGKVVYMWYAVAAAACLVIGLTIVFRNVPDKKQNETVAEKTVPAPGSVTPSSSKENVSKKNETLAQEKKTELQSSSKKKSIQEKKVSEQPQQIASVSPIKSNEIETPVKNEQLPVEPVAVKENDKPVLASKNSFSYNDIFSKEELKELQRMSADSETSRVEQLAKKGLNRLGDITGVQVQLPDKRKEKDVFAFSIGSFEVRHVSGK